MQISTLEETVADFKRRLETESGIPAAAQRLIFRGHILRDAQTFADIKTKHGLENGHSMHVVPAPSGRATPSPSANTNPNPTAANPARGQPNQGMGINSFGMGPMPGIPAMPGMPTMPGMGTPSDMNWDEMMQMHQQMLRNPEQMQAVMNSPIVESIMSNPEVARSLMMANPQMRELMERNPEIAHVFNDPSTFRQMMQMARNPSLMNEMMRNTDRQMANIEMMPGGFDALRRMHENIQAPLMDAAQANFGPQNNNRSGNNPNSDNPFSSLFEARNTPSNAPMPNPWAPNNGVPTTTTTNTTNTANTPSIPTPTNPGTANAFASLFAPPTTSASPAANTGTNPTPTPTPGAVPQIPGLPAGMNSDQMMQMLENPLMQQLMQNMLSDPQMLQTVISSNPQLQAMMQGRPEMAQMLQNPNMMRTFLNPDVMRAVQQLQDAMTRSGVTPPDQPAGATPQPPSSGTPQATPPDTGTGTGTGTSNTNTPNNPTPTGANAAAPNMNEWMNMMNVFNSAVAGGGVPSQPQPERTQEELEEMYSSQLQQLRDMGFLDKTMCLQALQQSQGNVSAAIENLLSRFGG